MGLTDHALGREALFLVAALLGLGMAAGPIQPINAELAVDIPSLSCSFFILVRDNIIIIIAFQNIPSLCHRYWNSPTNLISASLLVLISQPP